MTLPKAAFAALLLAVLSIPQARAYRAARISSDAAELKDSPSPGAATVATLPKGTRLNTSDQAKDGYYRVRSASASGWVADTDLSFGAGPLPPNQAPETMSGRTGGHSEKGEKSSHGWFLTFFGGIDTFNPSALNSLLGTSSALNSGGGLGGELGYGLSKNWFLALRFESIGKNISGNDPLTGSPLSVSMSSTPVLLGLDYVVAQNSDVSLDFAGFLGEGMSTSFTINEPSLSPATTTFSGSAPAFELTADLNWHITAPLWLFGEVGYRYLNTSALTPTPAGGPYNGTANPSGALAINMTGLMLNFGLRLSF